MNDNEKRLDVDQGSIRFFSETFYDRFMLKLPLDMIKNEISGIYGTELNKEFTEIINNYLIYENGAEPIKKNTTDYKPSDMRYKKIRTLINKEARFMFSNPPTFQVSVKRESENIAQDELELLNSEMPEDQGKGRDKEKAVESEIQQFLDEVLKKNKFNSKIIRGAKDCFIGKRIAIFVNFDESTGIQIQFAPSLEFIYETDPYTDEISKIVAFFQQVDAKQKENQQFFKKKYEMKNGFCYFTQALYDGNGKMIEDASNIVDKKTNLSFIPAVVIINDGLTGDILGESEIKQLEEYEKTYTQLANDDVDAERLGMNNILYTLNASDECTERLTRAPGAYLDLQYNTQLPDGSGSLSVGLIEPTMSYKDALDVTLKRINTTMYETLDIPDVTMETLQGGVTTGKALKAIYWPLTVRCQEKMLEWGPQLESMAKIIIEGAKVYPKLVQLYNDKPIQDVQYTVDVENNYPIQEDQDEARQIDLQEIQAGVMSRKSYMKRHYEYNDTEVFSEIRQIALEKQILEDSMFSAMADQSRNNETFVDESNTNDGNEIIEESTE